MPEFVPARHPQTSMNRKGRAEMRKIMSKKYNITIAGGGSTYTPGIILMLMEESYRFPVGKIKLYDNLASRQEPIGRAMEIRKLSSHIQRSRKRHLQG